MELPEFDNQFQQQLPADESTENATRQVSKACYSFVQPKQTSQPTLIAASKPLAKQLGFSESFLQSQDFVNAFSGNEMLPGMQPYAMCYGGHQFGNWAGQLGDGRAINLGERVGANDLRWQCQLKGAGPTPYSRFADGLAVLRSSVREFLCSEAMFHLGVPTTRALSLISTGDLVERDMFYDGHPQMEPGAVVCRVAPSFLRFGNYEIFAARQDIKTLETLIAYSIEQLAPEIFPIYQKDKKEGLLRWFAKIAEQTCELVVHWMRVGFVHGVLNTDNMSVLGLTIDFGPYGWLDNFDPNWTPNTTDRQQRRYRYANQPPIAQWNLLQLANAFYPLINSPEELENILTGFSSQYEISWLNMMRAKLGLQKEHEQDQDLVKDLETLLSKSHIDMTLFYRRLADFQETTLSQENTVNEETVAAFLSPIAYENINTEKIKEWVSWFNDYVSRLGFETTEKENRRQSMNQINPIFILRNYIAQQAIDKAYAGDYSEVQTLLKVLQNPYEENPAFEKYYGMRPAWAKEKAGCSMLSCSS